VTILRYTAVICGVSFLSLLALAGVLDDRAWWAVLLGGLLATLNTLAAFGLAVWSIRCSPKVFMATVLGGTLGRMFLMLAAVAAAIVWLGLPPTPLVSAVLAYYACYLILELAVLHRLTSRTGLRTC
jgi:hypothetical protein